MRDTVSSSNINDKIVAIILNYNSSDDCESCICDLKKQENVNLEIVVVDNCSSSHELERIKDICIQNECTLLLNTINNGYSAGNNIGLRYASDNDYQFVAIVNPDMLFPDKTVMRRLVDELIKDEDAVIASSNILYHSRPQNPMPDYNYLSELFWFMPFNVRKKKINLKEKTYCSTLSGCFFVAKMSFLHQINFLDENVFLYQEEYILSKQVEKLEKKMLFIPFVYAVHNHFEKKKGNIKYRLNQLRKSRMYFYNRYCNYSFLKKHLLFASQEIQYGFVKFVFFLKYM